MGNDNTCIELLQQMKLLLQQRESPKDINYSIYVSFGAYNVDIIKAKNCKMNNVTIPW